MSKWIVRTLIEGNLPVDGGQATRKQRTGVARSHVAGTSAGEATTWLKKTFAVGAGANVDVDLRSFSSADAPIDMGQGGTFTVDQVFALIIEADDGNDGAMTITPAASDAFNNLTGANGSQILAAGEYTALAKTVTLSATSQLNVANGGSASGSVTIHLLVRL